MQWPPTPTPGLNGIKPYGFDAAAAIISRTLMPAVEQTWANSFISAMFTKRKVFSNSFAASATSGDETETTASHIES
jgi:hypothetical protein